jgi:hypothetical protein
MHGQNRGRAGFSIDDVDLQNHLHILVGEVPSLSAPEAVAYSGGWWRIERRLGSVAAQSGEHHHPAIGGCIAKPRYQRIIVRAGVGERTVARPVRLGLHSIDDHFIRVSARNENAAAQSSAASIGCCNRPAGSPYVREAPSAESSRRTPTAAVTPERSSSPLSCAMAEAICMETNG